MVEKTTIRTAYDAIATVYAKERSVAGDDTAILETFLESIHPPARILDVGCGQGMPILDRISHDHHAVGVDLSGNQLAIASKRVPTADLVLGDMTALPFLPGSFDAIVALWSLIHIPTSDQPGVIDAFAKTLGPEGRVLVCEGMHPWEGTNPDWLESGVEMQWDIAGVNETQAHLEASGFSVVNRWEVPEDLDNETTEEEPAWIFLDARLDE